MSALSANWATFRKRFSAIELVNTAYNVDHATKPREQRSGHKRVRARQRIRRLRQLAERSSGAAGSGNAQ
jgi:hypothetical protein